VFPYTVRIVSDILESNGSSSMASVCGGTLAMMDAGVPLKRGRRHRDGPGEGGRQVRDPLGHPRRRGSPGRHGLQGLWHAKGITAVQMDIKITGLTMDIMLRAMEQARRGRIHILDEMEKAIAEPRKEISPHAPRITRS
jgi:polyribonucleotide nucleotidyltransferase